jgi:hypothetical protein
MSANVGLLRSNAVDTNVPERKKEADCCSETMVSACKSARCYIAKSNIDVFISVWTSDLM